MQASSFLKPDSQRFTPLLARSTLQLGIPAVTPLLPFHWRRVGLNDDAGDRSCLGRPHDLTTSLLPIDFLFRRGGGVLHLDDGPIWALLSTRSRLLQVHARPAWNTQLRSRIAPYILSQATFEATIMKPVVEVARKKPLTLFRIGEAR